MVKIPAGIDDGSQLRLSNEGESGLRGGPQGNLYITLSVLPHEFFIRDGDNLLYELPVNFAQAALGAEVEVPTLGSTVKLKIPAGSQAGKTFRLKGQGIAHLHGSGRGDQIVNLLVVTPQSLTKKQRQLFEELSGCLGPENMPPLEKQEGLLGKFKNVFGA